jgi:RNA polymerase Rpb5, N-terminal domain
MLMLAVHTVCRHVGLRPMPACLLCSFTQYQAHHTVHVPQDNPTDQIIVFFPEDPKVGVKTIKALAERMRTEQVQRAIMVVKQAMTPFAKQCLQEMQPKYLIQLVG